MKKWLVRGTAASTLFFTTMYAQAASILPSTFNDDMTAVKTDINTLIGGLVGILIVILGWRYFKKGAN